MFDNQTTLDAFLTAAAAKQPTPGGGSITALVGALGASMGEMVLNYSIGKKDLAKFDEQLKAALAELTRARRLLGDLMVEDQEAFAALSAARKLPESPQRLEAFSIALLACIRVPQAVAATAVAMLEVCDRIVPIVNKFLLSDLAVAAELAMATTRCAVYNVKVNMADVSDAGERQKIEEGNQHLLARALPVVQRALPKIWERMAAGS